MTKKKFWVHIICSLTFLQNRPLVIFFCFLPTIVETTPGSSTTTTAAPEPVSSTTAAAEAASADDNGDMNISISSEKSSEEDGFMKARSDEFFPDTEDEEPESRERKDIVVRERTKQGACFKTGSYKRIL